MELSGEQLIPQSQDVVWRALNDPEILKACITGCESIEKISDTEFRVAILAAVGPVKARFNGKLVLADLNPPTSYSLSFEGQGGAAGFGKGGAQVKLLTEGKATRLAYTAKAQVGGKLAQVGSRLIDGVAKKLAEDFFIAFNARVGGPTQDAVASSGTIPAAAAMRGSGFNPLWLIGAAVALAAVALYFWLR